MTHIREGLPARLTDAGLGATFAQAIQAAAGSYWAPATPMSTSQLVEARLHAFPLLIPPSRGIDRLSCSWSVAGSAGALVRMGVYSDTSFTPGALLVDAGTVPTDSGSSASAVVALSAAQVGGKIVWLVAVPQGAPSTLTTFRTFTGSVGLPLAATATASFDGAVYFAAYKPSVTGALSDPSGIDGSMSNNVAIAMKVRLS